MKGQWDSTLDMDIYIEYLLFQVNDVVFDSEVPMQTAFELAQQQQNTSGATRRTVETIDGTKIE